MKRRTRLILAACTGLLGIVVLGYWYYGILMTNALVVMFEDLDLNPQVKENWLFDLLPYLGGAFIAVALALLFARRALEKPGE